MPMLDCPELAELDLEPAAAPFLQMHDPGSVAKQQRYNARKHPQQQQLPAAAGGGATTSAPPPPAAALVKLEADQHPFHHQQHQHHHQQHRDEHHRLGVRASTRFKHVLGEPCGPAWMSLMDTPHLQQQQQQEHHQKQLEDKKPITSPAAAPAAAAAATVPAGAPGAATAVPQAEDKNKVEQRRYPAPYCSCTGVNQQCYRWGNGGWQSACCTTKISVYPLPMNPKKKGSRVAGRKMSAGAFRKLLDRLAAEGVDVNNAVDLRPHWAKHGTNRYVTIK